MSKDEQLVAKVNGRPITQADLDNAVQGYALEQKRQTMDQLSAEELQEARDFALEKLLARELIFQEALARGVVADEAAVEREKRKIIENFPSEEEFAATLERAGITPKAYHRMLRQDVTVNLLSEAKLEEVPEPDAAEVERVYREHPQQMVRQGRVRASHILVRSDDQGEAAARAKISELQKRLAGEEFAQLARLYSQCPSAPGGGDLGYFRRGDMVKNFEELAFSLPVGTVGGPVQTQFGLHLVKVLDREEDAPLSLDEARPKIRKFLRDEAGSRLLKEWVERLREQAKIEFFFAADEDPS